MNKVKIFNAQDRYVNKITTLTLNLNDFTYNDKNILIEVDNNDDSNLYIKVNEFDKSIDLNNIINETLLIYKNINVIYINDVKYLNKDTSELDINYNSIDLELNNINRIYIHINGLKLNSLYYNELVAIILHDNFYTINELYNMTYNVYLAYLTEFNNSINFLLEYIKLNYKISKLKFFNDFELWRDGILRGNSLPFGGNNIFIQKLGRDRRFIQKLKVTQRNHTVIKLYKILFNKLKINLFK